MAFTGAATVVVAGSFQLIDPYGLVSGFLGNGNSVGAFPFATDYSELGLLHNDALTVDSTLRWSRLTGGSGTAGDEYVVLRGPAQAGSNSNRPRLIAAMTAAEGTYVQLDSGRPDGAADGTTSDVFMQQNLTQFRAKSLSILNSVETRMFDIAGPTDRGVVYGVSRHEASISGANVPSTVAAGILLTINLPNCPIAGAWADIGFTAAWLCQVAPGNSLNLQIRVNGVLVTPLAYTQNNANTVAGTATLRKTFAMPVGANTIDLVEYGGAATYAILGSDQTSLTVVLHR